MFWRLLVQDLAWGVVIFVVAAGVGLQAHGLLVSQGFRGELASQLDQWRDEQRELRFAEIKTINLEQAYALHRQGEALFVDARPRSEYRELHIAGAINLSPGLLKKKGAKILSRMDRNRQIAVYCGQKNCHASLKVAELLQAQGFSKVMAFLGGFRDWDEAGYPVDIDQ